MKGDVVEDVRPILKRGGGISDSILRLLGNTLCLPLDYMSKNLEDFRRRYREKFEEIPEDLRIEPPLRIGCSGLTHAAAAGEEPDIQEIFAQLLASASNSSLVENVHPGFATVINDLEAHEAKLIKILKNTAGSLNLSPRRIESIAEQLGCSVSMVQSGIASLVRLGVIEWYRRSVRLDTLGRVGASISLTGRPFSDINSLQKAIETAFREQNRSDDLRVSAFGRRFIKACISDDGN